MWAVVEVMGHRTRAGLCSDATIGGLTMLRIEHPKLAMADDANEPVCEYYAPSSIFAIAPCTEEYARRVAGEFWAAPIGTRSPLPPELAALVVDHDDDGYEDDDGSGF